MSQTIARPQVTNRLGLPDSLVAAVTFGDRNREGCDYTITELLEPPRILALKRKHADEITEDASDRLWALLGSAGHEVLRRSGKQQGKAIVEERAIIDFEHPGPEATGLLGKVFKIGGQLDYAVTPDGALDDFKFTSVYAVKDGVKPEWEQQLNLYRYLALQYGVVISRLEIIAILRDWSVREARRDKDYPQEQCKVFAVRMWPEEECKRFLAWRIALHEKAEVTLPECLPSDMWEKPEKWAAKKKGATRATRLFDDLGSAREFADPKGMVVELRPAERPRCESYCAVAPFCQQYKDWKATRILP